MKKAAYWSALVLFVYGVTEAASLATLYTLDKLYGLEYAPVLTRAVSAKHRKVLRRLLNGEARYVRYSPSLGWTTNENGRTSLYRANAQGIRSDKEYSPVPLPGVLRIAAFGDSFTHGDDVSNKDAWATRLEATSPKLEVLNFGLGGYGLDQALLRYQQDGVGYNLHVVLIGFMSENISRHVNTFRPFYHPSTGKPLTKPHFVLKDEKLVLVENPMGELSQYRELLARPEQILPRIGADDYYYHFRYKAGPFDVLPSVRLFKMTSLEAREKYADKIFNNGVYNQYSDAYKITVSLFDAFARSVRERRSLPITVLFPDKNDVVRHRKGRETSYAPLLAHFKESGHLYIDLIEALDSSSRKSDLDKLFQGGNRHYTVLGNRLVAEHIWNYLQAKGWANVEGVERATANLVQAKQRPVASRFGR